MIEKDFEATQDGAGDFHDVVAIQFFDGEQGIFGLLRVTRAPATGKTGVIGLLFGDDKLLAESVEPEFDVAIDDWANVTAGPARLTTVRPLEAWTAAFWSGDAGFDLRLEALTEALDLSDPEEGVGKLAGVREYAHMCSVSGTVTVDGKQRPISGTGWRSHVWGAPDWPSIASRRSLYYSTADGDALAILAGRPSDFAGHDDEVNEGQLVRPGGEPNQFDEILWSTLYDHELRPDSAGLELYFEGDEFPHRMVGKAVYKAALDAGARRHGVSFFRWSLDGKPGFGSYQTVIPH